MNILAEFVKIIPRITSLTSLAAFIVGIMFLYFLQSRFEQGTILSYLTKLFWLVVLIIIAHTFLEYCKIVPPMNTTSIFPSNSSLLIPGKYKGRIEVTSMDTSLIQPGEYFLNISVDYGCELNGVHSNKYYNLGEIGNQKMKLDDYTLPKLGSVQFSKIGIKTEMKSNESSTNPYKISFSKYD